MVKDLHVRLPIFLIAIILEALGVVLSTKSGLGMSCLSALPKAISLGADITLGVAVFIISVIYVIIQLIVFRRFKDIRMYTQLLYAAVLGYFLDFFVAILEDFEPSNMLVKVLTLIVAVLFIALNIVLVKQIYLFVSPKAGNIMAWHKVMKLEFGKVVIIMDAIHVVLSLLILTAFYNADYSILGVGTVIALLTIGNLTSLYSKLPFMSKIDYRPEEIK